jgi:hypothetical protein
MTEPLETPSTPLEEGIETAARAPNDDVASRRAVLTHLIGSRIAVLLDHPWDGVSPPDKTTRLQLISDGPNLKQSMLAVFSTVERAQQFTTTHGGFEYAVEVDAGWALLGVAEGQGLIINPNQPLGFRVNPEIARTLRTATEDALEHHATKSRVEPSDPLQ